MPNHMNVLALGLAKSGFWPTALVAIGAALSLGVGLLLRPAGTTAALRAAAVLANASVPRLGQTRTLGDAFAGHHELRRRLAFSNQNLRCRALAWSSV
jgi:hypothetical protein